MADKPTVTIKEYASVGDAMEEIKKTGKWLDQGVQEWQTLLQPGDHAYIVFLPGFEGLLTEVSEKRLRQDSLPIYYEIQKPDGEDAGRIGPNRRLVVGYSAVEPTGEWGTIHIASLWCNITAAHFATAKEAGWPFYMPVDLADKFAKEQAGD